MYNAYWRSILLYQEHTATTRLAGLAMERTGKLPCTPTCSGRRRKRSRRRLEMRISAVHPCTAVDLTDSPCQRHLAAPPRRLRRAPQVRRVQVRQLAARSLGSAQVWIDCSSTSAPSIACSVSGTSCARSRALSLALNSV